MLRNSAVAIFLCAALVLVLLASCSDDSSTNPEPTKEASLPTVTTDTLQTLGMTGVWAIGTVVDDGGAELTATGMCWSTSPNPTIADSTSSWGLSLLQISGWVCLLEPNTHYYIRAFATNSQGTAYGNQLEFTTFPAVEVVTDVDGNIYHTVTIGNQVWMVENLKVTHFADSTAINHVLHEDWDGYPFDAYCNYLDNPVWSDSLGRLYNWAAVMDPKGLAPEGWRIPNDNDWKVLEMYAGMLSDEADIMNDWRGSDEGGKLKQAGVDNWGIPNTGATDEFGFGALPGGYREWDGFEGSVGVRGFYWTSSIYYGQVFEFDAYFRCFSNNRTDILRGHLPKTYGMSVRCIKESK